MALAMSSASGWDGDSCCTLLLERWLTLAAPWFRSSRWRVLLCASANLRDVARVCNFQLESLPKGPRASAASSSPAAGFLMRFTFLYPDCQTGFIHPPSMSTPLLLELFAGFLAACIALWFVLLSRPSRPRDVVADTPPFLIGGTDHLPAAARRLAGAYFLPNGPLANTALLLLRLSIGVLMIHHGQEKLADPQQFANTYVASLHLPFPLFFAYAAGFSELIGSWLLILGLLTPLGALAITGTMAVAAYQHILTAGLNIYVLELVALYLGGSLALLLLGPGRFSFDGAIVHELLEEPGSGANDDQASSTLTPAYVAVRGDSRR